MKRLLTCVALFALLSTSLVFTVVAAEGPEQSYMVIAQGNSLPKSFNQAVANAGGTIEYSVPVVGVAVVSSTNPDFKSELGSLKGVRAVVPNLSVQWIDPLERQSVSSADIGDPPNSGASDSLFDLQWGHAAIDAPEAWAAGATGEGVLVAVLDDGIDSDHPDLAPNLNLALSTSFVPNETYEYDSGIPGDPFSHGTHVAGTIAAAMNGLGTIGVAPDAEIFMVKVLESATGSGSFAGVIAGIVYAADSGADVINMSLGAHLERSGFCEVIDDVTGEEECMTAREVAEVATAMNRATNYAYQQGSTIISSAGNSGIDSNRDRDGFNLPADSPKVISVSALGPLGWAVDPETNLDEQAFYTNYGLSSIDFSAPGGNIDFDLADSGALCTVAGLLRPCYAFDLVFSTGSANGYYWSAGTSMASPHVAGVAALIIGENGGSMNPAHVERELRATADDLGKPGRDALHGHGRVNAGNVVD